tara:strand:+ start:158 stop:373 length:216 start_codon:yes stop_codon:yes gene_type:complete
MEENKNELYESVHNYTKYKLVEMLIDRMNDGRLNLDNLNAIEDVADDVLKVLSIAGLKYYSELKTKFNKGE